MADITEDQMEAVFKSSRTEQDPVSGNEVPTGSLPEEVRDDIPAKLSEGEYVVPADVVRYYGVRFFEDLRNQAKVGWSDLEQGGRIGGDPAGMEVVEPEDDLPFDVSELQTIEMADGGVVPSGDSLELPDVEMPDFNMEGGGTGFSYIEYTNSEGRVMLIPFFMGEPMIVIPEGFYPLGEQSPTKRDNKPKTEKRATQQEQRKRPEPIDYAALSKDELAKMVEDQTTFGMDDGVGLVIGAMNPLFGLMFKGLMKVQANQTQRELERRIADDSISQEDRAAYTNLLDIANQERPGLFNRLADMFTGKQEEEQQDAAVSDPSYDPAAVESAIEEALGYTPEVSSDTNNIIFDPSDLALPQVTTKGIPTNPRIGYESGLDTQQNLPRYLQDSYTPPKAAVEQTPRKTSVSETVRQANDPEKTDMAISSVMDKAAANLATPDEMLDIFDEGEKIKGKLDARSKGASVGFSKGGLASKKKKK